MVCLEISEYNIFMDQQELLKFINEANQAGYASGDLGEKQTDGSTTFSYENGEWRFHDNYFGGEPYGGRDVVFYNEKPVWMMTYYGRVSERSENTRELHGFLQDALKLAPKDKPFRGPALFGKEIDGRKFEYTNEWQGDITYFSGEEKVLVNDDQVYDAKYAGGLVDL